MCLGVICFQARWSLDFVFSILAHSSTSALSRVFNTELRIQIQAVAYLIQLTSSRSQTGNQQYPQSDFTCLFVVMLISKIFIHTSVELSKMLKISIWLTVENFNG